MNKSKQMPKMIDLIVGARPNFMKISPVIRAMEQARAAGNLKKMGVDANGLYLTLRDSTEHPETINMGTNELVGTDPENLATYFDRLFAGQWKKGTIPPL